MINIILIIIMVFLIIIISIKKETFTGEDYVFGSNYIDNSFDKIFSDTNNIDKLKEYINLNGGNGIDGSTISTFSKIVNGDNENIIFNIDFDDRDLVGGPTEYTINDIRGFQTNAEDLENNKDKRKKLVENGPPGIDYSNYLRYDGIKNEIYYDTNSASNDGVTLPDNLLDGSDGSDSKKFIFGNYKGNLIKDNIDNTGLLISQNDASVSSTNRPDGMLNIDGDIAIKLNEVNPITSVANEIINQDKKILNTELNLQTKKLKSEYLHTGNVTSTPNPNYYIPNTEWNNRFNTLNSNFQNEYTTYLDTFFLNKTYQTDIEVASVYNNQSSDDIKNFVKFVYNKISKFPEGCPTSFLQPFGTSINSLDQLIAIFSKAYYLDQYNITTIAPFSEDTQIMIVYYLNNVETTDTHWDKQFKFNFTGLFIKKDENNWFNFLNNESKRYKYEYESDKWICSVNEFDTSQTQPPSSVYELFNITSKNSADPKDLENGVTFTLGTNFDTKYPSVEDTAKSNLLNFLNNNIKFGIISVKELFNLCKDFI